MHEIYRKDVAKRQGLRSLLSSLEPLLTQVVQDSWLRTQLEGEDVISVDDYKTTIEKLEFSLRGEHCPVVLAGRYYRAPYFSHFQMPFYTTTTTTATTAAATKLVMTMRQRMITLLLTMMKFLYCISCAL